MNQMVPLTVIPDGSIGAGVGIVQTVGSTLAMNLEVMERAWLFDGTGLSFGHRAGLLLKL